MAIFHLAAQVIGRSSGRSATAAAAYRAGARIVDTRTGEIHDFTRKGGVRESFIVAPDSAPTWMNDRASLWNGVEAGEKRKDAQLAREIEVSLPHELPHEMRRTLLSEFIQDEFVARGMVADVAMHAPGKEGDRRNEHAHIMLTLRHIDGNGFGTKAREWNDKNLIESWRESWAQRVNKALDAHGVSVRVDHRSFQRQAVAAGQDVALTMLPTVHLGPDASQCERRGVATVPGDINREVKIVNLELKRAGRNLSGERNPSLSTNAATAMPDADASRRAYLQHRLRDALGLTRLPTAEEAKAKIARKRQELAGHQHGRREELQRAARRASEAMLQVKRLSEEKTRLAGVGGAFRKQAQAVVAAKQWRALHPLRARLHDWGLLSSPKAEVGSSDFDQLRAQFKAAKAQHDQLEQQLEVARAEREKVAAAAADLQERVEAGVDREEAIRLDQAEALADELQPLEQAEDKGAQLEPPQLIMVDHDHARPIPQVRRHGPAPSL